MKKIYSLLSISIFFTIFFLSIPCVKANWLNTFEKKNIQTISNNQSNPSKPDSLPNGVTKNWLNSLTDEKGNPIFSPNNVTKDDPETDAVQRNIFVSPVSNTLFGYSISCAGDVNGDGYDDIIVGASDYSSITGRAYIYFGGASMNTVADVTMTGEATLNGFGFSVSGAGDVNGDGYSDVIVGAPNFNSNTGKTYIFFGGSSMDNIDDLHMTGEAGNSLFGSSVSSAGDINGDGFSDIIVGARGFNSYTGRSYIFLGGSAPDIYADVILDGEVSGAFGASVSGAGDVNGDGYSDVIVGAPFFNSNMGKAYIFLGGTSMGTSPFISILGQAINNYFGASVSGAGDLNGDRYSDVIIGAYGYSSNTGRAYILFGSSLMDNNPDILITGNNAGAVLGRSVSRAGDVNGDDFSDIIVSESGKVHIFFGGSSMNNISDINISGDGFGGYGISVSGAGDVNSDGFADLIVGDPGYNSSTGGVYLYDYFMRNEIVYDVKMSGTALNNFFGSAISDAGDVNGDGYSDVIVGAFRYNSDMGRAYIYFGGTNMDTIADVTMTGEATANYFGAFVSGAGDVNNDGYSDVIVSAYGNTSVTGRAYIFLGGPAMDNLPDLIINGHAIGEYFGRSVSGAGDVNGDGFSDVIIGAFGYSSQKGRAYIYFGGSSMNNTEDVTMTGAAFNDSFGFVVSGAGDVNGDNYSDVVVQASAYNSSTGRVYTYFGGSSMNNVADLIMTGTATNEGFGGSLSGADVNGDGYSDLIISGASPYIYLGGIAMDNVADITLTREIPTGGYKVSGVGDVNGDGYSDVLLGAFTNSSNTGKSYLYFGGSTMNSDYDVTMKGETMNDYFGQQISGAGDINGDGYSDIIAGSYGYYGNKGRTYIFLGSAIDPKIIVNVKMFIEGFYSSTTKLQKSDTVKGYLRNNFIPYDKIDSAVTIVSTTGNAIFKFQNAPAGNYFVVINHRNSVETWSAASLSMNKESSVNYDFTNASSQAFENNTYQVDTSPIRFAIYSGDVTQNGFVDLTDIILVFNNVSSFATGYVRTDVNGDYVTDLKDIIITFNNSSKFVKLKRP